MSANFTAREYIPDHPVGLYLFLWRLYGQCGLWGVIRRVALHAQPNARLDLGFAAFMFFIALIGFKTDSDGAILWGITILAAGGKIALKYYDVQRDWLIQHCHGERWLAIEPIDKDRIVRYLVLLEKVRERSIPAASISSVMPVAIKESALQERKGIFDRPVLALIAGLPVPFLASTGGIKELWGHLAVVGLIGLFWVLGCLYAFALGQIFRSSAYRQKEFEIYLDWLIIDLGRRATSPSTAVTVSA